jgi:hypothetical protein
MDEVMESSLSIAEDAFEGFYEGYEHPITSSFKYGGSGIVGALLFQSMRASGLENQRHSSFTETAGYAAKTLGANMGAGYRAYELLKRPGVAIIHAGEKFVKKAISSLASASQKDSSQGLSKIGSNKAGWSQRLEGSDSFKKYTKFNCRKEFIKATGGVDPGPNFEVHHNLPRFLEKIFARQGINIHEPQHLTWVERGSHRRYAYTYNEQWKDFLEKNKEATKDRILEHGKLLMSQHPKGKIPGE